MRRKLTLMAAILLIAGILLGACTTPAAPTQAPAAPAAPAQPEAPAAPEAPAQPEAPAAPEATEAQPEAPAEPAPAAGPAQGGTILMARDSEPMTLNPMGANENGSIFMIVQIFDTLVETQDQPTPQPAIAESWTVSDDSLVWEFKLRPGVKFSNGDDVTCEDVQFSIDRFANPEVNAFYSGFGSSIETTECKDDSTFVITLNRVEGAFLDYLATFIPSIIPKAVYEEMGDEAFGEKPVGSGPFMVTEWVRGQRLVLERNPYYWKEGKPYVDSIVVEYIPDDNTRMLKIESGEADIATEIPYSQLERIGALPDVKLLVEDVMAWDAFWFNQRIEPLNDKNVVLALNYATPKEAMLNTLMHGAGDVANHIIARVKYWDSTVPAYPYDLDKAKEALAASSVPDGFDLKCLIVSGDQVERQQAEVIQQEWAKLNVNMEIEAVDVSSIWDRWGSGEEMCFTYPGAGLSSDALSDDNLAVVFLDNTGGADSFWTGYNSARATELVQLAGKTIDEEERTAYFHELQRLVMDEFPAVPLFFVKARTAVGSNVEGFKTLPVKWWNLEEVYLTP